MAHSLSPRLFAAGYGAAASDGAAGGLRYELIEGADFKSSWARFLEEYDGINVTMPFKEKACQAADILSPEVEVIGAANLVVKTGLRTMAYNTDYSAVALLLLEAMKKFPLRTALVVGCGGAGKAAAVAALEVGLKVTLTNRTPGRAADFADSLSGVFGPKRKVSVVPLDELAGAGPDAEAGSAGRSGGHGPYDVVIYCLPCPIPQVAGLKARVVLEANYLSPVFSADGDFEYISGRRWLQAQAVTGFRLLTGLAPDACAMEQIAE